MLQLAVHLVHDDQVDRLRGWMSELQTSRRVEAIETLVDETVDHEVAVLVDVGGRHLLVYAMEVRDPEQSRRSADSDRYPINAEHHAVLRAAIAGIPDVETLLDLTP